MNFSNVCEPNFTCIIAGACVGLRIAVMSSRNMRKHVRHSSTLNTDDESQNNVVVSLETRISKFENLPLASSSSDTESETLESTTLAQKVNDADEETKFLRESKNLEPRASNRKTSRVRKENEKKEITEADLEDALNSLNVSEEKKVDSSTYENLLKIETKFFNYESEQRKRFGSSIVKKGQGRGLMVKSKASWPKTPKFELRMKQVDDFFLLHHSELYEKSQEQFHLAVQSLNLEYVQEVLRNYPFNVDALLVLSDAVKSENVSQAADLIERALYVLETSCIPAFKFSTDCFLPYECRENRFFFLICRKFHIVLFRHIQFVMRKGCYRSCLEFTKLLFHLDCDADPLCAIFLMDYLAFRSGEYQFLIDFYSQHSEEFGLDLIPSWRYTLCLCLYMLGKKEEAQSKLLDCFYFFPNILSLIANTLDLPVELPQLTDNSAGYKIMNEIFAERHLTLWQIPEAIEFFKEAVSMLSDCQSNDVYLVGVNIRAVEFDKVELNFYRHLFLCDSDRLMALIPSRYAQSGILSFDPIPSEPRASGFDFIRHIFSWS